MVLHGDLHARIDRLGAERLANFDGVRNAGLDSSGCIAIIAGPEDDADHWRTKRFGDTNAQREMFLRVAPLVFESFRGRTNAPGAHVNLQAAVGGFFSEVREIALFEVLERVKI